MKIYLISRGFPTLNDPQWGIFEKDQAKALIACGHEVIMLSLDVRLRFRRRKYGITIYEDGNLRCYNLYVGPLVGIREISLWLYDKICSRLLLGLYRKVSKIEGMPDIIYAHYLKNIRHAFAIKQAYHIPLIGIEHWSEVGKDRLTGKVLKMGNIAYPRIDKLIVVSSAQQKNISRFFNVESQIVNNIVGDEFVYGQLCAHRDTFRLVSAGSLIPRKCFDLIIKGLTLVKTSVNYQLDIVGDGPLHKSLQLLINQCHLEDKVRLLGRKNRQEIVDILHKSDVYILASSSETFGVAAVEALACGIPVIATDCGGPRDFITQQNGLLIPTNDIIAMKEAIEYMIEHQDKYNRESIANDCHNRFSASAIAKQLSDIFEQVKNDSVKE